MPSFGNASAFGIRRRGLLHQGFAADLFHFDSTRISPQSAHIAHDLPRGAWRLVRMDVLELI